MKQILSFLTILFFISCNTPSEESHPREVWVFRSVLDEMPRMVTAALDEKLWVAYDTQTGLLYRAWSGDVLFDGAVYTTVHGPQPQSLGATYYQMGASEWMLTQADEMVDFDLQYKGHLIKNEEVFFNYEFITPEGDKIKVSESPRYVNRGTRHGLKRIFNVENTTGYEVKLKTSLGLLSSGDDYETDGSFSVIDQNSYKQQGFQFSRINGILSLNKQVLHLTTYFHAEVENLTETSDTDETSEVVSGALLIEKSDCAACHNEKIRTVGPSYLAIAKKYNDDQAAIDGLAQKIIKGGSGVWGVALMTPHPDIMPEDAKTMVSYILGLDDKLSTPFDKYTLGLKSIPVNLSEKYEGDDGQGFLAHLYLNLEKGDPLEVIKKSTPVLQGKISKIHTLSETDFLNFQEHFIIEYKGLLNIEKESSYDFRLISDDGSLLYIDEQLVVDNGGDHGTEIRDGEMFLKAGKHPIRLLFNQGGGGALVSLQWFDRNAGSFVLLDDQFVSFESSELLETKPYIAPGELKKGIPGDALPLAGVHPAFDLSQARPNDFTPKVGGLDFLSDGRMVICTWDSLGSVFILENWDSGMPDQIKVKRIAAGLAEPLGLKVVDEEIYVLQKQELTKLIDHDGDELIDEYQTVSNDWKVSANFHEFAFGLVYQEGFFYGTLATAIMPGGASANPQIPDRGKVLKIDKATGKVELIATGLRTPNGIGVGKDNEIFIADNQGDWLPASKIVHVQPGSFYGSRSVDFEGTAGLKETLPVVWLPQDEIGNSPSTPIGLDVGPYQGQMIHGEVTNGGIKRVYVEKVNGAYQGALFRFTQGLEAGVNRILWAPNGDLVVGGVGSSGNWGHIGKLSYGLQSLSFNGNSVFEMLKVSVRSDGFEIEFTEPIKEGQNVNAEDFLIQQWRYEPTEVYGGPKLDLENLEAKAFHLSQDRKKIFVELPGIKENRVVYFRINRPFISDFDHSLWTTESWYTLNQIPKDQPGFSTDYQVMHNALTEAEQSAGWKLLFNGKDLSGLRNYNSEDVGSKWDVEDGTLHLSATAVRADKIYPTGDNIVVTDRIYENYEFYVEWKVASCGNSGIIYNVIEDDQYGEAYLTGPEMQILDNSSHTDGQYLAHRAGDLYDMIPAAFVTANGPNDWNRVRLIVKEGHVEHWLNGYKLLEFDMWDDMWDERIKNSKFKEMPAFGTGRSGHIVLQDHRDEVWFRNIKIKTL